VSALLFSPLTLGGLLAKMDGLEHGIAAIVATAAEESGEFSAGQQVRLLDLGSQWNDLLAATGQR